MASRHLNLTRAAIELCVTQAALSYQIRWLKEFSGITLFRRVPRGLVRIEDATNRAQVHGCAGFLRIAAAMGCALIALPLAAFPVMRSWANDRAGEG